MRVLYITHYDTLMGANKSMLQLILELRKLGIIPTVLFPHINADSELEAILKSYKIKYIKAPIRMVKHPRRIMCLPNYFISLLTRKRILKSLDSVKYDIVHSNSSVIDIGNYISKKIRAKHFWHLREFGDLDYNLRTPFCKKFQKIIYCGDNHFIAISKKIALHYKPYISNQKMSMVYNGVKIPIDLKNERNNSILQFCIVGLICEKKGQFDVIKAVNELVNKRGIKNFHVTIIGDGDVEYLNVLHQYIKEQNLHNIIEFTGKKNDIEKILAKMDVGIMSSANEAFGRVTIEYMMSGLAVIASDGGANREIITDKSLGYLYSSGDFIVLADKMADCIMHPNIVRAKADKGQKYAVLNFSSDINSKKIYQLYCNYSHINNER